MTLHQQQKEEIFKPSKYILVQYATAKYDMVWTKKDNGKVVQAMLDLGEVVREDCRLFEDTFQKYGDLYFGPNDMYKVVEDPSYKDIMNLKNQLFKELKTWKEDNQKPLVIYIFACHGIQESGSQGVVVNEFDKRTEFYKIWKAEAMIRTFAKMFPNSYHLSFFVCCREIYNPFRHTGCVGGTHQEAVAMFKAKDKELEQKQ